MIRQLLLAVALVFATTWAVTQQSSDGICNGSETPCDSNRPWMRGTIEKSCALPNTVERLRREKPGAVVLECACKHNCDPEYEHAGATTGRRWDGRCQARCNPNNCMCPNPCD